MIYRLFPLICVSTWILVGCSMDTERLFGLRPEPKPEVVYVPPPRQVIPAPPPAQRIVRTPCQSETCKRECAPSNPHKPRWCAYHIALPESRP